MFHSMNNSYPLFYHQSPSFNTSLETNNIPFQHPQEFYNNYLIPQISENTINKLLLETPINLENTIKNPSISSKRVAGRRDRHTKICTAQGIRDRRVRLSINIARDFFNLQDMLGFDKASKTLGWLMEKSKDAIKELTNTTNYNKTNEEHNNNVCKIATTSKKRRKPRDDYNDQSVVNAIRRSSRVKARERARERTKNKKTIQNQRNYAHLESSSHHQHDNDDDDDQHEVEQDSRFHESISGPNFIPYGISNGVVVGQSVVLKSKSRDSCHNYNYDMITNDYEMGYNNNYLNDQNNGGIIQTPGLSALNIINFSTEIHINAKPWDNYNNQHLN
ncbi:uncharacterized protein LOC141630736 [Silene latifolia]|uniref:uncharacterized protein LOC141630736 n=1 Tax=Silene latifolia TaxID=37657 RepID=UPI003D7866E0